MSETEYTIQDPAPKGGGAKNLVLIGAVVVLAGATGYLYMQVSQLRADLADTKDQVMAAIAKTQETTQISSQTSRKAVEDARTELTKQLEKELRDAKASAATAVGQAKEEAAKQVQDVSARLAKAQEEQNQKVAAVSTQVAKVEGDANANKSRIGEVSTEVGTLRTEAAATKSELEKTIADLKSTRGDLGVQSGLIATNSKELSALKALGERNYTEFKLAKEKTAQRVGDVQIRLKSVDQKKNRYTIELIADDKLVEKKDKTINEPVQFLLSRATQPYELVVNEVKKDLIVGYVSAPKVQQSRK